MYSVFGISLIILRLTYVKSDDYKFYPAVNVSYKFHSIALKWGEARLECIKENATLALPKNNAEASVLKSIFAEHPQSSIIGAVYKDYILLRFHDLFAENEYVTDEGIDLQYFYHEWGSKEPDNKNNEDCGSMFRLGWINDFSCNIKAAFVCQKEIRPYINDLLENKRINSDIGYKLEQHSKKRFKLHLNPKPWDQARIICQSEGGQLANIESKQEETFLLEMFNKTTNKINYADYKDAFLGFHDYFIEGDFVTTKGKSLNSIDYVRWKSGEPNNARGNENCGSMDKFGFLNDIPCDVTAFFFCEMENTNMTDVSKSVNNDVIIRHSGGGRQPKEIVMVVPKNEESAEKTIIETRYPPPPRVPTLITNDTKVQRGFWYEVWRYA